MTFGRFDTLRNRVIAVTLLSILTMYAVATALLPTLFDVFKPKATDQQLRAVESVEEMSSNGWKKDLRGPIAAKLGVIQTERGERPLVPPTIPALATLQEAVQKASGITDPSHVRIGYRPPPALFQLSDSRSTSNIATMDDPFLNIAIKPPGSEWINLAIVSQPQRAPPPPRLVRFLPVLLVFLVSLAGILAVKRATGSLDLLTRASRLLGLEYRHDPIPEEGPRDVRNALAAFNDMGRRLELVVNGQRGLLAAIGHDLRTPITSLRLRAELLQEPAERSRIKRSLDELERVTEAALAASKVGYVPEAAERLDLYSLVESLCEDLNMLGEPVKFREGDDRPVVEARKDELARAIRNVILNAVIHGGNADVEISLRGKECAIIVNDCGPGIPEDMLTAIFEPLVRLEDSRNRQTGGHGLGLYIAKSIIEEHSGTITVTNRPEGGANATITLPICEI